RDTGLWPVHGQPHGHPRARRGDHQQRQPQLSRTHGDTGRAGLPRQPVCRRRQRCCRCHHRPARVPSGIADLMTTAPLPLRTRIGHIVTQVIAARATWVFAAAWLLSALVLVVSGYGFPVFSAVMAILYLLFCLLTVAITEPN